MITLTAIALQGSTVVFEDLTGDKYLFQYISNSGVERIFCAKGHETTLDNLHELVVNGNGTLTESGENK